jgi:hypothetical protein
MPQAFTLTELQKTYEALLGRPIEKKSFLRKPTRADVPAEEPQRAGFFHTGAARQSLASSHLSYGGPLPAPNFSHASQMISDTSS